MLGGLRSNDLMDALLYDSKTLGQALDSTAQAASVTAGSVYKTIKDIGASAQDRLSQIEIPTSKKVPGDRESVYRSDDRAANESNTNRNRLSESIMSLPLRRSRHRELSSPEDSEEMVQKMPTLGDVLPVVSARAAVSDGVLTKLSAAREEISRLIAENLSKAKQISALEVKLRENEEGNSALKLQAEETELALKSLQNKHKEVIDREYESVNGDREKIEGFQKSIASRDETIKSLNERIEQMMSTHAAEKATDQETIKQLTVGQSEARDQAMRLQIQHDSELKAKEMDLLRFMRDADDNLTSQARSNKAQEIDLQAEKERSKQLEYEKLEAVDDLKRKLEEARAEANHFKEESNKYCLETEKLRDLESRLTAQSAAQQSRNDSLKDRVSFLQKQERDLQAEVDSQSKLIQGLQETIKEKSESIEGLERKITDVLDDASAKKEFAEASLRESRSKGDEIIALQDQIRDLERTIEKNRDRLKKKEKSIQSIEDESAAQILKISQIERELVQAHKDTKTANETVSRLRQQIEDNSAQGLESHQKEIRGLESRIQELVHEKEQAVATHESSVLAHSQKVSDYEAQIESLKSDIDSRDLTVNLLNGRLKDLQASSRTASKVHDTKVTGLKDTIQKLDAELTSQKSIAKDIESTLSRVEADLSKVRSERDKSQKATLDLQSRIGEMEVAHVTATADETKKFQSLEREHKRLEREYKSQTRSYENLKSQLESEITAQEDLKQQLRAARDAGFTANSRSLEVKTQLEGEIKKLESQLRAKDAALGNVEQQLRDLREAAAAADTSSTGLKQQLNQEIGSLSAQLQINADALESLEREYAEYKITTSATEKTSSVLKHDLDRNIEDLKKQLQSKTNTFEALEREFQELKSRPPTVKRVEVPVEKIIEKEVPVEVIVEKAVEKIIEKEVPIEVTIEKIVERIVEKEVPVEVVVEKLVQVPVEVDNSSDELAEEIETLQLQLMEKSAALDILEQKLKEVTSAADTTGPPRVMQHLDQQIEVLEEQLASQTKYSESLQAELASTKMQATEYQSSYKSLKVEMQRLEADMGNQFQELQLQLAQELSLKDGLQTENDKLRSELTPRPALEGASEIEDELKQRIEELRSDIASRIESEVGLENQNKLLRTQLKAKDEAQSSLEDQLKDIQAVQRIERKDLKSQLRNRELDIEKLNLHLESLSNQNRTLQETLNQRRARETSEAQIEIDRLTTAIETLNEQVEILETNLRTAAANGKEQTTLVRRREGQIDLLKQEIRKLQKQSEQAAAEQRRTYAQLDEVSRSFVEHEDEMEKLRQKIAVLDAQLRSKNQTITSLQNSISVTRSANDGVKILQQQIADKTKEIDALQERVHSQEEQVRKAQVAAFNNLGGAKHAFLEDSEIEQTLKNDVFFKLEKWVRDFVPRKAPEVRLEGALAETLAQLSDLGEAQTTLKKHPQVIVQALLSTFVAENLLGKPFFLLSEEHEAGLSASDVLQNLYDSFLSVDVAKGHSWRFETFQLLSQIRKKSTRSGYYNSIKIANLQSHHCEQAARAFVDGPAAIFIGPNAACLGQLTKIFNDIADIAFSLWSQKAFLTVRGFKHLTGVPFNWDSLHVQAHALHHLSRPGKTHSRDGDPIAMVVQPEIVAYGNEEGEEYDKEKVWAKAVISLSL
ncbi:hypothetical protein TWF696_007402 [Orbilia brochopaga]|uniref:Uncharacterized protein n=1 Tax=Orbilia brochopaga TaxID=3140254 RepID=A0AAV9URX3_9PEZI